MLDLFLFGEDDTWIYHPTKSPVGISSGYTFPFSNVLGVFRITTFLQFPAPNFYFNFIPDLFWHVHRGDFHLSRHEHPPVKPTYFENVDGGFQTSLFSL